LTLKRGLVACGVVVTVLAVGATVVWQSMVSRLDVAHDGFGDDGVFVTVEPGDSTLVIARRFVETGVVAEIVMQQFRVGVEPQRFDDQSVEMPSQEIG